MARGDKIIASCENCGTEVTRLVSQIKGRMFCCKSCADSFKRGKSFTHEGQFKKGQTPWNTGLTANDNDILKHISELRKVNNPMKRKEVQEKSSKSHQGKMASLETRQRMSARQKERVAAGEHNFLVHGNHAANRDERDAAYCTPEYKFWRDEVFRRDSYKCQRCGKHGGALEAHHVKSWRDYPDARYDISNGITLCPNCHAYEDPFRMQFVQHVELTIVDEDSSAA